MVYYILYYCGVRHCQANVLVRTAHPTVATANQNNTGVLTQAAKCHPEMILLTIDLPRN